MDQKASTRQGKIRRGISAEKTDVRRMIGEPKKAGKKNAYHDT